MIFILVHLVSRLVLKYISEPGSQSIHALCWDGMRFKACNQTRMRGQSRTNAQEKTENAPDIVDHKRSFPLRFPRPGSTREHPIPLAVLSYWLVF